MRWANWFVVPGTVSDGEERPAAVRRVVRGNFIPTPDDVIEPVHKLLRARPRLPISQISENI